MRIHSTLTTTLLLAAGIALAACGEKSTPTQPPPPGAEHSHEGAHGGRIIETSDHGAHFELLQDAAAGLLRLWAYDGNLKPLALSEAPVLNLVLDSGSVQVKGQDPKGGASSTEWHFSHEALKGHVHGRLRVTHGGKTWTPALPDDHDGAAGHGGGDAHGPHDGVLAALTDAKGAAAGFVELKLHDDKGDLELWVAKDRAIKEPLLLALEATVRVVFEDRDGRTVTLRVRDTERNEDEEGVAQVRDGKTHYFIFPGESGEDAAWLTGAEFSAKVHVAFGEGAQALKTATFVLRPHGHGDDHGHAHDR